MSGGRDLNPRPSPWQGDVLPLNYRRNTELSELNTEYTEGTEINTEKSE